MSGFVGDGRPGDFVLTSEGGFAVWLINDTGAPSIKGYIAKASLSIDNAFEYTTNNNVDPVGVVYDNGVANGGLVRIVVSGIAEVYYGSAVTRGTFSRVPVSGEGIASGQAINEALPVPPFATDKHFQEIGHPIESRGTPGLAKTVLHFN